MDVEKADIIKGNVLSSLVDSVIASSIYDKMVVIMPVLKDCGAVHDSGTWRSTTKCAYLPFFDRDDLLALIHIIIGDSVKSNFVFIIMRLNEPEVVMNSSFLVDSSKQVESLFKCET